MVCRNRDKKQRIDQDFVTTQSKMEISTGLFNLLPDINQKDITSFNLIETSIQGLPSV